MDNIEVVSKTLENVSVQYHKLKSICEDMFEHLKQTCGEDEAYTWAEDNISSDWRTELDINRPMLCDIVEVNLTCKVAVPRDSVLDITHYLGNLDWSDFDNIETIPLHSDIPLEDIQNYGIVNDLEECEF